MCKSVVCQMSQKVKNVKMASVCVSVCVHVSVGICIYVCGVPNVECSIFGMYAKLVKKCKM